MKKIVLVMSLLLALSACKREETPVAGDTQSKTDAKRGAPPAQTTAAPGTEVGSAMPAYSALWLDGSKFDLAERRGKVVLLNIWATWCGPCRYEIPELQRMHDEYAKRGFEVIGASVDESGFEAVKEFVAEQKMTYPVVLDAEGKIATMMQTSVLPTTVLVDRTGKIVWKKYGAIFENDEELKKAIEKAL